MAGRRNKWPDHISPVPPNEIVAAYIEAAHVLRDGLDSLLATFDPDDEAEKQLGPLIDAFDARSRQITEWIANELEKAAGEK